MKGLTAKGKDLVCFLTLNLLLAVSGWIATRGFQRGQSFVMVTDNPTPFGYSKSLVLFLLPSLVFGVWLHGFLKSPTRRKAFWLTVAVLFPVGLGLDILFGLKFFTFDNPGSVLGSKWPWCTLWAYDLSHGQWRKFIPIEEALFYFLGFVAILLTYIWADEVVFGAHKVNLEQKTPQAFRGWIRTIGFWSVVGAALFGLAYVIRANTLPEGKAAFPGYFLFLLLTAILPSMVCSRLAFHFVNFRALSLASFFVLGISQFWEAGLAIPYRWWGYQKDQMMGLFIKAQCDLPVEAILVWTLATWAAVMVYESILNLLRIRQLEPTRRYATGLQGGEADVARLKRYYAQ